MDRAGGSRDQATVSWWSSFLSKDCGSGATGRCCSGAGVISGPRCRARGSFRGSGGTGRGCEGLVSEVEVGVKICFEICSEDCVEGEFQVCVEDCVKGCFEDSVKVIGEVRVCVKIFVKDGQC